MRTFTIEYVFVENGRTLAGACTGCAGDDNDALCYKLPRCEGGIWVEQSSNVEERE